MKKRIGVGGFTSLLVLGLLASTSQVHAIHLGPEPGCFTSDLNGRWGFRCENTEGAFFIGEWTGRNGSWNGSGSIVFADGTLATFTYGGTVEVSRKCLFKAVSINNFGQTLFFEGALVNDGTEILKMQTGGIDAGGSVINITGKCTDKKQ